MKNLIPLFVIFISNLSFGQVKHDYTWLLGYSPDTLQYGWSQINFKDNQTTITQPKALFDFGSANGSISDENGNLLFYTNGCEVANADHKLMQNGDLLNPGEAYETYCAFGYAYPNSKSIIILPSPDSLNLYYIFHTAVTFQNVIPFSFVNRFYYSKVDMNQDDGLGAVAEKNQLIFEDAFHGGDFSAVRHSNNKDWWLVLPQRTSNRYFIFLFSNDEIQLINEQQIGPVTASEGNGGGHSTFSPNGQRYARYNSTDQVLLLDFDRGTGLFENPKQLFVESSPEFGGVAFSPNSKYLYVASSIFAWQFDTEASMIQPSRVLIATYDGHVDFILASTTFYMMQLAPDCKIYINSTSSVLSMHIIHSPNEKGLACNFEQRGLKLPTANAGSQPNFPNYRLGTSFPVCDSNIVITASPMIFHAEEVVKIYPNPVSDILRVELFEPFRKAGEMILYNQTGQAVRFFELGSGPTEFSFSVSELVSGMYFYRISEGGILRKAGKIIVQE